jgi:hypothetical protein
LSDIEFTKVTFNGASFKLEKDARSEKWLHVGKDRIKYSKADSKDGVAKTIRVFFSVDDNIPEKERELETLKKIEDYRLKKIHGGLDDADLARKIVEETYPKQYNVDMTKEKLEARIKERLKAWKRVSARVVPAVLGLEEIEASKRAKKQVTKTIASKEDFINDYWVNQWINDKSKGGIASKATKARNNFISSLYRVFELLNIQSGTQFKNAGGAENPQEQTQWLKKQFAEIVEPYLTEEYAVNPKTKKFEQKSKSWQGGAGVHYQAIMAARSFADFLGFALPKTKDKSDPLAAHVRGHGKHAKIEIPLNKIEEIKTTLKKICTKEKNMDPYMYFMVGLATGMRKAEGLTIPLKSEFIKQIPNGFKDGKPFYEIRLFNRKILHTVSEKSLAYTESVVYDYETCELIADRMKEGKKDSNLLLVGSVNANAPDNFIRVPPAFKAGNKDNNPVITIEELPESEETFVDNTTNLTKYLYEPLRKAYIKAELIEQDESEVTVKEAILRFKGQTFNVEELEELDETTKKQAYNEGTWNVEPVLDKEGNQIKKPKFISGYNERSYFWSRPLHSVRHAFAQFWLRNSEWNFAFVAEHGHWKTIEELKTSYGGIPKDVFISNSLDFVRNAQKSQQQNNPLNESTFKDITGEVKTHQEEEEERIQAAESEENKTEDENE